MAMTAIRISLFMSLRAAAFGFWRRGNLLFAGNIP